MHLREEVQNGRGVSLKLPLTLPVWSGHSCPLPLTLILILTLILTLTGKGTSSTRAASALHVWSGHSCPLPLILNLISQMHAQPLPGRARAALQQPALSEAERAV